MDFPDQLTVSDHIDGDLSIKISENIKIYINISVDLNDVFLAVFPAVNSLYDRNRTVYFVQPEQIIYLPSFACLNVNQYYTGPNSVNVYMLSLRLPVLNVNE